VARDGAGAEVTFRVRNTGDRAGAAVPQIYVSFPRSAGEPPKQLKGFDKLTLAPGQSRRVTIHLGRRAFAHWDRGWTVDAGRYGIAVGSSSRDLPLRGRLTLD
jgi:beta-glucosidase